MAELLKEAIADAKAVREVALQNAKMALEEAFDSKIKSMLSAKLAEEIEEDVELEEEYIEEEAEATDEGYDYEEDDKVKEVDDSIEEDIDEEINLDELMAELEEMSYEEDEDGMKEVYDEDEKVNEGDLDQGFIDSFKKAFQAAAQGAGAALRGSSGPDTTLSDLLLKLAKGANSYEDWKKQALDQGGKLIKSGEVDSSMEALDAIVNSRNWKALFEQTSETEIAEANSDFDIDALIAEIEADLEEGKAANNEEALEERKRRKRAEADKDEADKKLKEALATVSSLQETISEMNLLNSKLLYCNKLFRANALTEAQKVKVVDALDKSTTAGEAKLVFETLQESFNFTGVEKRAIKEGLGRASKAVGTAPKKVLAESVDETVSRFQKLANINK